MTTKIWQLSILGPPIPIREIRKESRQVQSSFLAKQPKHPPSASSSWHSRATGWLQTQFRATSKWRLEKAQMVNCSRIPINYKDTDIIQDCLGKTRPLAEIEMLQTNNTLFVCLFVPYVQSLVRILRNTKLLQMVFWAWIKEKSLVTLVFHFFKRSS